MKSATVVKTTAALIEAARVLFTRKGYARTTMSDIAREAKRGRRTLYMHFPSKEVLLRKVIETELNRILEVLREIAAKDIPADRKIMELVFGRLENVRHTIFRNGSLRADFTRFYLTIDSIRRKYDKIEIGLIRSILIEGREQGLFHFGDAEVMAEIIREKMLWTLDREIPHGTAVEITTFTERDNGIIDLDATIYCEKASHKGIIIGKQGAMLKKIGSAARFEIERMMEVQANLQIWVKVRKDWRDSDLFMKNFGYDKKEI